MGRKAAYLGVFTALALVLSYVETLIPISFGIPGVKLGLANLAVVLALYKMGPRPAFCISVVRILLAGLLFGNLFGILYSLAGGVLSFCAMAILKRRSGFGICGVSMAGGVSHNIGQILVAMAVVETFGVAYYIPVLLVAGVVTGLLIGIAAGEMLDRLSWMDLGGGAGPAAGGR